MSSQQCFEPTEENAAGGKGRKGGTIEEGGLHTPAAGKAGLAPPHPCLLHTRLGATLDFVVVVILQDCDGNCVVIFHLEESSLMAGGEIFHLEESRSYRLDRELLGEQKWNSVSGKGP